MSPLIDSHCHLHLIDLSLFDNRLENVIRAATDAGVEHMLSVSVELDDFHTLCTIADKYPEVSMSTGVHPAHDNQSTAQVEPDLSTLTTFAKHPRCVAIGETGLDYFHVKTSQEREHQQQRFATHIAAATAVQKPLIIHTREAAKDTIDLMRSEKADRVGGVMHCFTESYDIAKQAMDMNFYISISGIITFKNAEVLRDLAKRIPLDRLLIETDSPFLAPVPFRGKPNHPALVKHVAETLSALHNVSFDTLAEHTTRNFYQCFKFKV